MPGDFMETQHSARNEAASGASVLVLNAGSSTLKVSVISGDDGNPCTLTLHFPGGDESYTLELSVGDRPRQTQTLDARSRSQAIRDALHTLKRECPPSVIQDISVVGHRVVHGGTRFRAPVRITPAVLLGLQSLSELAPLHNPGALDAMEAARQVFPQLPHVAVFDTAFFQTLPELRWRYAVPRAWEQEFGARRFGFHGISHRYCAMRVAHLLRRPLAELRVVTCHLGAGSSATAIEHGKAVATTMGFTPLDGMMMASRPGSLDPGLITYVLRHGEMSVDELEHQLNDDCGMKAVSGISSDYRTIQRSARLGHEEAQLAILMFADHVRQAIGALATTLGGIDVLAFTGGIGEHSETLRTAICRPLAFLGIELDERLNATEEGDRVISPASSTAAVCVVHSREDLEIAREVRTRLSEERHEKCSRLPESETGRYTTG